MALRYGILAILTGTTTVPPVSDELIVKPGQPVAATVAGAPAQLLVVSGRIDRLTLDADFVAAHGFKPATLMGKADLSVANRREFKGFNRSLDLTVAGLTKTARAFWFPGAPDSGVDGAVGPFGLPQGRVTFALGPAAAGEIMSRAPLNGDINRASFTGFRLGTGGMGVSFDVDDQQAYPVASAAAGALIARTLGGSLSGASWDVEVLMGVKRPVRLLRLDKPLQMGPLSFTKIAVRVRDRIDASGRGQGITDADVVADPSEVVVEGVSKKGPRPLFTLSVPRTGLAHCSRITFDKVAKVIELMCRPTGSVDP